MWWGDAGGGAARSQRRCWWRDGDAASEGDGAGGAGDLSEPAGGPSVAAGSAVNLVVSTGPAPVTVPNVVGQTQAAATTAITNAGLVVGTVTQQASATVPAGRVITQNPPAGTRAWRPVRR